MSAIVRVKKKAGFTTVSNAAIADPKLSWEAAGLLAYLLTKPDNWEVRNSFLEGYRAAGRHKMNRMLAELKTAGYLRRYRSQEDDGRFTWVSEIYEDPAENQAPICRKSAYGDKAEPITRLSINGSSIDGSSINGKPGVIINTDPPNTEIIKTEEEDSRQPNAFAVYEQEIGTLSLMIGEKLGDLVDTYSESWVIDAMREAAVYNKRSLAYIEAILKNWKANGRGASVNGNGNGNGRSDLWITDGLPYRVGSKRFTDLDHKAQDAIRKLGGQSVFKAGGQFEETRLRTQFLQLVQQ